MRYRRSNIIYSPEGLEELAQEYRGRGMTLFRSENPDAYSQARKIGELDRVRGIVGDRRKDSETHARAGGRPPRKVPTHIHQIKIDENEYHILKFIAKVHGVSMMVVLRRMAKHYMDEINRNPNFR